MSLREKFAWISLLTTIAVYVPYFVYIYRQLHQGALTTGVLIGALVNAGIGQTLLAILATVLFAFRQRKEPKDERDTLIEAQGSRNAYRVLASSCFLIAMWLPIYLISPLSRGIEHRTLGLLASQIVLLCFVFAEIVRYFSLAVSYRRGI